ncbi:MAG: DUF2207 domain-containing protein [Elusimicrobiota bacterium]|jgi:hypothetical protein|nr:DUF2207 domain-containing protein [Elusimicrobiota bacterium]
MQNTMPLPSDLFTAFIVFLSVIIYFGFLWVLIKRSQKAKVPRVLPPDNLDAATAYYTEACGNVAPDLLFTSFILSAAAKWAVGITYNNKEYTLHLKNKNAPLLSNFEKAALADLFKKGDALTLAQGKENILITTVRNMLDNLAKTTAPFFRNSFIFTLPIYIVFLFFLWEFFDLPLIFGLLSIAVMAVVLYFIKRRTVMLAVFGGVAIAFLATIILGIKLMIIPWLFVCTFFITALGAYIIKAYTVKGLALRVQINGFKNFLAGKDSTPGEITTFIDFLPYATAFERQQTWAGLFGPRLYGDEGMALLTNRGLDAFVVNGRFDTANFTKSVDDLFYIGD